MKAGDAVYFLDDYNWCQGTVVRVNKKSITITHYSINRRIRLDKCAGPDEEVVLIWERWKGVNGRGAYRVDKDMYPQLKKAAKHWPHQGDKIWEEKYGVLTYPKTILKYLHHKETQA